MQLKYIGSSDNQSTRIALFMLALCSMLLATYYALNSAGRPKVRKSLMNTVPCRCYMHGYRHIAIAGILVSYQSYEKTQLLILKPMFLV